MDQRSCPLALADQNPFTGFESDLDMEGGGLVMRSASRWISAKGLGNVYMAYDVRNRFIENLYLRGLDLEPLDLPLLSFDSFRHRDTQKSVQWQMVVRRKATEAERTWSIGPNVDFDDFTDL